MSVILPTSFIAPGPYPVHSCSSCPRSVWPSPVARPATSHRRPCNDLKLRTRTESAILQHCTFVGPDLESEPYSPKPPNAKNPLAIRHTPDWQPGKDSRGYPDAKLTQALQEKECNMGLCFRCLHCDPEALHSARKTLKISNRLLEFRAWGF